MEVNNVNIAAYALAGAGIFSLIAIFLIMTFSQIKKALGRSAEKRAKKKESNGQVAPQKKESLQEVDDLKKQQQERPKQEVVKEQVVERPKVPVLPSNERKQEEPVPQKSECLVVFYKIDEGGQEEQQVHKLFNLQNKITIGRNRVGNDWAIEGDATVSGRHCSIYHDSGSIYIEDIGSTNGTFVNGVRIPTLMKLENMDEIRIGHGVYRIRYGEPYQK
ncbi:MAG: FHA domain-containing protein [Cellulosilyticaceae bacterium]